MAKSDVPVKNILLLSQVEHRNLIQWGVNGDNLSSLSVITICPPDITLATPSEGENLDEGRLPVLPSQTSRKLGFVQSRQINVACFSALFSDRSNEKAGS